MTCSNPDKERHKIIIQGNYIVSCYIITQSVFENSLLFLFVLQITIKTNRCNQKCVSILVISFILFCQKLCFRVKVEWPFQILLVQKCYKHMLKFNRKYLIIH